MERGKGEKDVCGVGWAYDRSVLVHAAEEVAQADVLLEREARVGLGGVVTARAGRVQRVHVEVFVLEAVGAEVEGCVGGGVGGGGGRGGHVDVGVCVEGGVECGVGGRGGEVGCRMRGGHG